MIMIDESSSDKQLVQQIQQGSGEAMSILYRRHQPAVLRYVQVRIYNWQQAQDLTGEIFLSVVSHLPQYQITGAPFTAWLFRIAHNTVISHRQKESRAPLDSISYADNHSRPEDNPAYLVENKLEMDWVRQGLQQLDETQRDVIILRFLIGLSLQETADALEKSVGAIKTLQHRGILALRVALQTA
ncbi:MAG: RNA polymerase sigma factor [Anaerolineae bacterium]|nr:RNA polymerase sigma factor [Anaerolineae bacterium]